MLKTCRGCGVEKSLDEYHVDKSNRYDGHKNFCKECVSDRRKTPLQKTDAKALRCSKCKIQKPRSEFSECSRAVRGAQDWCKDCLRKYHAAYAQKNKERLRKHAFEYYNKSPRAWAIMTIGSHRRRGHAINLTIDDLYHFVLDKKVCPICGVVLSWGKKNGHIRPDSPSLDRIDNAKELNIDNIWIICARCNAAKGEMVMIEFIDYCKNVATRFERGGDQ